jgi:hypothetical protein
MQFSIHANICDQNTTRIADVMREPFEIIASELCKDYGGTMEHLWIDFELNERHAELRGPFPFRFQKKVGGSIFKLTGLPTPERRNVGHYSVRPDFRVLRSLPPGSVVSYALSRIYASTVVLVEKQKKLGGFDAHNFRSDFASSCKQHRFTITKGEEPG